jgi:hypothetical protein
MAPPAGIYTSIRTTTAPHVTLTLSQTTVTRDGCSTTIERLLTPESLPTQSDAETVTVTATGGATSSVRPTSSAPKIARLVGAAVAGANALAATIIICFYCWRRRRRQRLQRRSLSPWHTSSTLSNRSSNRRSWTQSKL